MQLFQATTSASATSSQGVLSDGKDLPSGSPPPSSTKAPCGPPSATHPSSSDPLLADTPSAIPPSSTDLSGDLASLGLQDNPGRADQVDSPLLGETLVDRLYSKSGRELAEEMDPALKKKQKKAQVATHPNSEMPIVTTLYLDFNQQVTRL